MLDAIEDQKIAVTSVIQRVTKLSNAVLEITEKLSHMKRPSSSLSPALPPIIGEGGEVQRPQTSLGQSAETKRVTWDLTDVNQEPPPEAGDKLVLEGVGESVKTE
jgi:hypothetical protein